jgi:hypothetical protein
MLVNVDEGNDKGVCDDVLGYGKIITDQGNLTMEGTLE